MDSSDVNDVSQKVNLAIKCIKKLLTPSDDCLIIQEKRKIDTISEKDILRKEYKPLDQRKWKHYSG